MSNLVPCELHPQITFGQNYPCPVCARTDSNIIDILRKLKRIEEKLEQLEAKLKAGT